jgi:dUTP pyrophosphatase
MFKFRKVDIPAEEYEIGDRVGQIIIIPFPKVEFNEVQNLDESDRGTGGFGHTGR